MTLTLDTSSLADIGIYNVQQAVPQHEDAVLEENGSQAAINVAGTGCDIEYVWQRLALTQLTY